MLAAVISDTSFVGVWFLEIVACFFALHFAYKILALNIKKGIYCWVALFAVIIYSCASFYYGDTVEELCLPFFMYALYLTEQLFANQREITNKEFFVIGITSGCIFWMKYSILGYYVGWFIIPVYLMIKNGDYKKLLESIEAIATGVLVVTIPIIAFFTINGALNDLLHVYFYENIITYSSSPSGNSLWIILRNLLGGAHVFLKYAPVPLFVILAGMVLRGRKDWCSGLHIAFTFFVCSLGVFCGGQGILYYPFALMALVLIGIAEIAIVVESKTCVVSNKYTAMPLIVIVLAGICTFALSTNTSLLKIKYEDMPQYKFKEIICEKENPTLLNYGFIDGGFFAACNIIPNCKYFCQINVPSQEMYDGQQRIIDEGGVDFVVTRNEELKSDNYQLVSTANHFVEGSVKTFYLYELKSMK